jgi:serine/threonine protein kinase
VAIKTVRSHLGQRFYRLRDEARDLAALNHPNVVQIHDLIEAAGHLFIVMEYVPGGSLRERLGGAPQPPRPAAELVAQVADAVEFRGLIHRDLKPGNVLLAPPPGGAGPGSAAALYGVPKVTDFGLARRFRHGAAAATTRT